MFCTTRFRFCENSIILSRFFGPSTQRVGFDPKPRWHIELNRNVSQPFQFVRWILCSHVVTLVDWHMDSIVSDVTSLVPQNKNPHQAIFRGYPSPYPTCTPAHLLCVSGLIGFSTRSDENKKTKHYFVDKNNRSSKLKSI